LAVAEALAAVAREAVGNIWRNLCNRPAGDAHHRILIALSQSEWSKE